MKRSLFALALVSAASSAASQEVQFRSGEHGEFTRLVATLPSTDTKWTITAQDQRYTIKFDGDDISFKTNTIFDKIARNRLDQVIPNAKTGEIELQLACDCRIVSIPYNDRYVIFDIRDGRAPSGPKKPKIPLSFGVAVKQDTPQRVFRYTLLEAARPTPAVAAPKPRPNVVKEALSLRANLDRRSRTNLVREQLAAQIGRAATQNLLQTLPKQKDRFAESRNHKVSDQNAGTHQRSDAPAHEKMDTGSQNLNVSAYNVIDEAGKDIAALLSGRLGSGSCLPEASLDIASWGGDGTFDQQLGELRKNLVGEFDRTQPDVLEDMARFYIHYTFGVEARQILDMMPYSNKVIMLSAMAQLVEDGTVTRGKNPFINQGHCDSQVAFWAALGGDRLVGENSVKAVVDTLNSYPRHLREQLAPHLSNRLVEMGETEAALLVLNAVERVNPTPGPQFEMAQAALDAEVGNTEKATETLKKVASENTAMTTYAVVELIESHIKQDIPLADDTIALVGALAVEHKSGAMGPDLRRAHALARMQAQDFATAYAIVAEISGRDGASAAKTVRSQVTSALAANADGFDVIDLALRQKLTDPGRLKTQAAMDLATRLFALGFSDETKKILQSIDASQTPVAQRMLRARLALQEQLPKRAEAELLGLTGAEADELRAQARSLSGDHDAAATLLTNLGQADRAEAEAWLGGNWNTLSDSQVDVHRKTSELVNLSQQAQPAQSNSSSKISQGILAQNRDLLSGSAETREILSELLNWHNVSKPSS